MFFKQLLSIIAEINILSLLDRIVCFDNRPLYEPPKLIFSDTEGVLTPRYRNNFEIDDIVYLQSYIKKMAEQRKTKIVINTGRGQGYVEMLCQMLGMANNSHYNIPHIIENGAAFYDAKNKEIIQIIEEKDLNLLHSLEDALRKRYPNNPFESKKFMVTLNITEGQTLRLLASEIERYLLESSYKDKFEVHYSNTAVDISYKGINKETALAKLIQMYYRNEIDILQKSVIVSSHLSDFNLINERMKAYNAIEDVDHELSHQVQKCGPADNQLSHTNGNILRQVIEKECGYSIGPPKKKWCKFFRFVSRVFRTFLIMGRRTGSNHE